MKFLLVETGALLLILTGCANPGKSDSDATSQAAPSADAAPSKGTSEGVGNIAFEAPSGLIDLEGYIVGSQDQVALRAVPDVSGTVGFVGVPAGTYDIILSAKKVQPGGDLGSVGTRLSGVDVRGGKNNVLPMPELRPTLVLKGSIHLQGDLSPSAVSVQTPGTHFRVPTDKDGGYSLAEVPVGTHSIEFIQPGFEAGSIGRQDYRESLTLPRISLMRESEAINSGIYYLGAPQATDGKSKVTLYLKSPKGLSDFRYGVEGSLDKKAWQVFQSSIEIDLPPGKNPRISVQYSKEGTQLSPIYTVTIPSE